MNVLIKRLAIIAFILASANGFAQIRREPRTLFNDSISITGGFLNFTPRYTNVLKTDVMLIGFSSGIVIDRWLSIGVAGAWSTSTIKNPYYEEYLRSRTTADLSGLEMRYGYGGLFVEPTVYSRSAVHFSLPVLIGIGSVAYSYPQTSSNNNNNNRNRTDGQAFFVVEPGVELEVSIVRALRIGVGGSYIYTVDLALPNTSPDALRNFAARLSLKVGSF